MAIENRQQLEHTQSQIMKLELVLDTLKREEPSAGYRLLSEGYVEQIAQMRREIDEYLDVAEMTEKPLVQD
jgi:hypothetical protein